MGAAPSNHPSPLWISLLVGLAVGAMPWLHTRLTLPASCLASILALRIVGDTRFAKARGRHLAALFCPAIASGAAWLRFMWIVYGTINPSAPFGGGMPLQVAGAAARGVDLFVDQEFGLLANSPVYVTAIVGMWFLR